MNAPRRESFTPVAMGVVRQNSSIHRVDATVARPLPRPPVPAAPEATRRRSPAVLPGVSSGRLVGGRTAGRVPPAVRPPVSRVPGRRIRVADPFRFTLQLPVLMMTALSLLGLASGLLDQAILATGPAEVAFAHENVRPDVNVMKASLEGLTSGTTVEELVFTRHRLTRNETVSRVAYDYGLSPSTLISVNRLDSETLGDAGRGTVLIVPYRDGFRVSPGEGEGPAELAARYGTVSNQVQLIPGTGDFFISGTTRDTAATDTGALFHYPVVGRVIAAFGTGVDNLTGIPYESEGIDLSAAAGTDVRASRDGTVIFTGHHASYGLYVMMSHAGGWKSFYGHLSRIDVAPGDRVKDADVIGAVGDSGTARSPRLHFVLFRNGDPVDPLDYLY